MAPRRVRWFDIGGRLGSGGVAAVVKGLDNPFFQPMESGHQRPGDDSGVDVTVQAANSITDTTGQADKLNGLASRTSPASSSTRSPAPT